MRHYYRIETSSFIGAQSQNNPAITCESMNTALDKLTEIGNEWRDKLNAPLMREIGGRCELRLLRSESITGLFGDEIIRTVRIDRPLHSPSARVIVWDENETIVSDSWKEADNANANR